MNKEFLLAYNTLLKSIGSIKKDSDNPYFKSKYADLNAVFEEVKEKIDKNGFILLQNVEHNCLHTQIIHIETGEKLESYFDLITVKPDMQQLGSAVTYARRYSLLPMLNIECEDDDGNLACSQEKPKKKDFSEMETEEEFTNAIKGAKAVPVLNALYHNWVVKFPKGSEEYNRLNKISGDMKLKLSNPDLNVEVRK